VSGRRGERRFGIHNALEYDGGLAHEDFEDFAFQPAVAKRHAAEVVLIDSGRLPIMKRGH